MSQRALGDICQAGQGRLQFELVLGEPHHQDLTRPHLLAEDSQPISQAREGVVRRDAALLASRKESLEVLEVMGGLLKQGLNIRRHRSVAGKTELAAR